MNCLLVLAATAILVAETLGVPLNEESLPGAYLDDPGYGGYGGYPVMDKRRTVGRASRPQLADYLRLAALQYELDREEADGEAPEEAPYQAEPEDGHAVEKRRRRYGFWVTAINKMGNGKRSVIRPGGNFVHGLNNPVNQNSPGVPLAKFFANAKDQ